MKTLEFRAPDIECGGCVASIKRVLGPIPGVATVDADAETKRVRVTFDESMTTELALIEASTRAGFPPAAS